MSGLYTRKNAYLLIIFLLTATLCLILSPDLAAASPSINSNMKLLHSHHGGGASEPPLSNFSIEQAALHIVRVVYYVVLLFTAGIMLWSLAEPAKRGSQHSEGSLLQADRMAKWRLYAMRVLLVVVLLHVFLNYRIIAEGYVREASDMLRIFTETRAGNSWLALLAVSLLGFVALKLDSTFKALWALLLLAAECYNGHVLALDSTTVAILSDYIHIIGGALWAGGLMLLLLLWYKDREEAARFAPKFSTIAWISIVGLTASGILLTWLILPSWTYLLYTSWGVLLMIKTALVLAVIWTGYALRKRVKRRELPSSSLLKLDGILMGAIVIIVSVFTYLSPEPMTEPLNYHQMGETLHYTLQITPNGPGPNEVAVKIWLPEAVGEPQEVKLSLKAEDRPRKAPIEVSLSKAELDEQSFEFPGFVETDYRSDVIQLPYPGPWIAELVIVDQSGTQSTHTIPFSNK